jgi:phenylacetate-coenzyme A ligase PaaK-like adenylate-forming protein
MLVREIYYFFRVYFQFFLTSSKKKKIQRLLLNNILNNFSRPKYFENSITIKKDLNEFKIDSSIKKIKFYSSSGSVEEVTIPYGDEAIDYNNIIFIRSLILQGYNIFQRLGFYWYRKENNSFFNKFGISSKILLKPNDSLKKQFRIIKNNNIKYLYYFPFKLLELVNNFSDYELKSLNLKRIFLVGEICTEKMRSYFQKKFKCPVSINYASTEFNVIAFKNFDKSYYHINYDNSLIEFKDTIYGDNIKEVIITSLSNYLIPLIRYKIGDIVEINSRKRILKILGKKEDIFTINGKEILLYDLVDEMMNYMDFIRLFNFSLNRNVLLINIIPRNNYSSKLGSQISSYFIKKFGILNIKIKIVDSIKFSKRGKMMLFSGLK